MKPYEIAAEIKPSKRQLEWQKTEFYGFVNIGLPTVVNREWTEGNVKAENFVPEKFNAEEWVTFFKEAGFKGMVLNVKHHDGFCLWYSAFTDYSVENAFNWEAENRDMVQMRSEECARQGLKFGIAISPLDRRAPSYGKGEEYNVYFKKLLREVLTKYGDIFYVRFDGAADENKDGYTQEYDWEGYYEVVRECQPDAVIALVGPDVRWYGNEWGVIRKNEWSVVPKYYSIEEAIKRSKEPPSRKNKKREKKHDMDLGSRKSIKKESEFIWYPCEVSVSMRDRWYYHKEDEYSAKTKDKLQKLYLEAVGGNCALMLGVPPMKDGSFSEMDYQILMAFGKSQRQTYNYKVSSTAQFSASSSLSEEFSVNNLTNSDENKTWKPAKDDLQPEIVITFKEKDMFDRVLMMEHIENGQHVEEYELYIDTGDGKFKKVEKGGVIGYKRIHKIAPIEVQRVKIKITSYRGELELQEVTLY